MYIYKGIAVTDTMSVLASNFKAKFRNGTNPNRNALDLHVVVFLRLCWTSFYMCYQII